MIALVITGCVIGYLLIGGAATAVSAILGFRHDPNGSLDVPTYIGKEAWPIAVGFSWPVVLPGYVIYWIVAGIVWLVIHWTLELVKWMGA